jgi:Methyltransferase FkbM domain
MITGFRSGLFALGLNVTNQTKPSDVFGLIQELRPLDCGKNLIRIGAAGDGGYLVPDDLEGIEYCFSPGVNTVSDFENHLADLGIKSFLADYSVDGPPISRPEFTFDKKFLGSANRGEYFTLASWKDKYIKDYTGDLILQMDIEGAEYEVITNIPDDLLKQFRILVIEFHGLGRIFDPFVFAWLSSSFKKLMEYFYVAHIHPNNCSGSVQKGDIQVPKVIEVTFLNKNRVTSTKPCEQFPHKLDADNFPQNTPLHLPKCWYSSTASPARDIA